MKFFLSHHKVSRGLKSLTISVCFICIEIFEIRFVESPFCISTQLFIGHTCVLKIVTGINLSELCRRLILLQSKMNSRTRSLFQALYQDWVLINRKIKTIWRTSTRNKLVFPLNPNLWCLISLLIAWQEPWQTQRGFSIDNVISAGSLFLFAKVKFTYVSQKRKTALKTLRVFPSSIVSLRNFGLSWKAKIYHMKRSGVFEKDNWNIVNTVYHDSHE